MKTIIGLILFLFTTVINDSRPIHQVMAQNIPQDQPINLTVQNTPLGDVLATLTQTTGYQFNINSKWKNYPVTTSIENMSLERGLKRLLRSLNHTIIWDSDRSITIRIFGKVDTKTPRSDTSFSLSPPADQAADIEPVTEPDSEPAEQVETEDVTPGSRQINGDKDGSDEPEPVNDEVSPEENNTDEPGEEVRPETDESPNDSSA